MKHFEKLGSRARKDAFSKASRLSGRLSLRWLRMAAVQPSHPRAERVFGEAKREASVRNESKIRGIYQNCTGTVALPVHLLDRSVTTRYLYLCVTAVAINNRS